MQENDTQQQVFVSSKEFGVTTIYGATNNTQTSVNNPAPTDTGKYFESVVLAIGVAGTLANGLMLFVLSYFKKNRQHVTNILILNQTGLDFLSCISLIISYGMKVKNLLFSDTMSGLIICVLLESSILTGVSLTGSIVGLVVIAFERYVKIVHSVFHKKYYKSWMLYIMVAIPWTYSATTVVPIISRTAILVNGKCFSLAVWPHPSDQTAYGAGILLGNFLLPVSIFIYCYGRIALVIRRSSKMTMQNANGHDVQKTDSREKNIVKTMMTLALAFTLCWLPCQVYYILMNTGHQLDMTSNWWFMALFVSFLNSLLNPILYAWQYDTVKNSFRLILQRAKGSSVDVETSHESAQNHKSHAVGDVHGAP